MPFSTGIFAQSSCVNIWLENSKTGRIIKILIVRIVAELSLDLKLKTLTT